MLVEQAELDREKRRLERAQDQAVWGGARQSALPAGEGERKKMVRGCGHVGVEEGVGRGSGDDGTDCAAAVAA